MPLQKHQKQKTLAFLFQKNPSDTELLETNPSRYCVQKQLNEQSTDISSQGPLVVNVFSSLYQVTRTNNCIFVGTPNAPTGYHTPHERYKSRAAPLWQFTTDFFLEY